MGWNVCGYIYSVIYTAKGRLFQVDIDKREQCCAANYEQVVNHVVPSCYS